LAAIEAAEIVVIEEFLPKALDEAGLDVLVAEAVAEVATASGKKPLRRNGPGDEVCAGQAAGRGRSREGAR